MWLSSSSLLQKTCGKPYELQNPPAPTTKHKSMARSAYNNVAEFESVPQKCIQNLRPNEHNDDSIDDDGGMEGQRRSRRRRRPRRRLRRRCLSIVLPLGWCV